MSTFDIPIDPRLGNARPIVSVSGSQVQTSAQFFGVKPPAERPDHRGKRPPSDAPTTLPPYGSPSRGPVERRHISREDANAQIARQAAQAGAQQTLDVGALQSQVAAQAAVIAQLEANNAALAARLDALEGGTGEAA